VFIINEEVFDDPREARAYAKAEGLSASDIVRKFVDPITYDFNSR
jgi:hypothetical protein